MSPRRPPIRVLRFARGLPALAALTFGLPSVDAVAAAAGTVTPGAIDGTVTEAVTGEPVADLLVLFTDLSQQVSSAITGADGRYASPPLAPGLYFVQTATLENRQLWLIDEVYDDFSCFEGHCDRTLGTAVEVRAGETTAGIDFALDRGGVLTGRVTREADGEPLARVEVDVWSGSRRFRSSLTGTDGIYLVQGLPANSYTVIATNFHGLIDEVHAGRQCLQGTALGCDQSFLAGSTPVSLELRAAAEVDFALAERFRPGVPCQESTSTLCLAGGRYRLGLKPKSFDIPAARARRIARRAAAFAYFADDNVEAVVKVLDACTPFGRTWVFAAGLTHLAAEVGVLETATGEFRFYPLEGRPLVEPVLDTSAFACSAPGGGGAAAGTALAGLTPALSAAEPEAHPGLGAPAGVAGDCVPAPTRLCLRRGRFAVEAEWVDAAGGGAARSESLGDRSGYFWFARRGNPEVVVKLYPVCHLEPPGFLFIAAGLTNREVRLTVTDTATGESREYENPLGRTFEPVLDRFESCP